MTLFEYIDKELFPGTYIDIDHEVAKAQNAGFEADYFNLPLYVNNGWLAILAITSQEDMESYILHISSLGDHEPMVIDYSRVAYHTDTRNILKAFKDELIADLQRVKVQCEQR